MLWNNGKAKELDEDMEDDMGAESKVMIPGAASSAAASTGKNCLISEGTVITGDIVSEDSVTVAGSVKGSLTIKGAVHISGSVKGDVSGENVTLDSGSIEGNVTASGYVQLERDAAIRGNVNAKDVRIKIGATIIGDITAESNAMEAGAVLQGKLNIGNAAPDKLGKAAAEKAVAAAVE
jgi:cytoskeletal protein CcmA (bactofilin family)